MANYKIEFLDYVSLLLKHKKTLFLTFFISLFTAYGFVFFFIEKEYEATAVIIPKGSNSLAGISSVVKNISSVLPVGLGSIDQETEMDLYNTIIYSRTSIEEIIDRFGLQEVYKIKERHEAIKLTREIIKTKITIDNAYEISVRAKTPQLASDMTNFIVKHLNDKIVDLNVSKAKADREFLEKRYVDINENLEKSENVLKRYQEKTGVFEASNQVRSTIDAFSKLESELAAKQVEYRVLKRIHGANTPIVDRARVSVNEFKNRVDALKNGKENSSSLLSIDSIPQKALSYYRLFRNVKINETMLEFVLPMYEQAKFEEQKMTPILQVIDYAVPPERKAYPPRTLFSGVVAIISVLFVICYLTFKEYVLNSKHPKIIHLKKELFSFK
ncbi:MAG: GumC family protein [Fibrobacterota bacterium]